MQGEGLKKEQRWMPGEARSLLIEAACLVKNSMTWCGLGHPQPVGPHFPPRQKEGLNTCAWTLPLRAPSFKTILSPLLAESIPIWLNSITSGPGAFSTPVATHLTGFSTLYRSSVNPNIPQGKFKGWKNQRAG